MVLGPRIIRLAEILLFLAAGTAFSWGHGFATPTLGLDPGWQEALVQGTDAGRLFGVDIIFTFGPYHQLYTQQISTNQTALILGRWLYGFAWGAAMVSLARISSQSWAWIVTASLALSVGQIPDATFFCLVFLFTLLATRLPQYGSNVFLITLCYAGVVLGVFTKLSFLGVAAPAVLLVGIYLVTQARRLRWRWHQWLMGAAIALLIPCALWLAAGQPLWSLSSYLMGSNVEIIKGYKTAMGSNDPAALWQIPTYLIAATCLGSLLYRFTSEFFVNRLWPSLLLTNLSFLMWVAFNAGMVRHDGHAATSGLTLAGVAIILMAYGHGQQSRKTYEIINVAPLLLGLAITAQYLSPIRSYLGFWLKGMLRNAWTLVQIGAGSHEVRLMLLNRRESELLSLRSTAEKLPIPKGSTVDAFPWDITDLIVNDLSYLPRPVIQSYSVYTDHLLDLNAKHYRSTAAPMFLVLKGQSIDQRFPPDLDGPALVEIGKRYEFFGTGSQDGLVFKKIRPSPRTTKSDVVRKIGVLRPQNRIDAAWSSDWLTLPDQLRQGSSLTLEFDGNLYRKAVGALFKPSQLWLEVRFADSRQEKYRVIESASRNLPLVPMVRSNGDLRLYLQAQRFSSGVGAASSRPVALRLLELDPVRGVRSVRVSVSYPAVQPSL